MTTAEQRIAIAEACGWRDLIDEGRLGRIGPMEPNVKRIPTPNYLHDLNAMHEAEKIADQELYTAQLLAVIHDVGEDYFSKVSWENAYELTTATAAQRAEAFLRTIGKWKE